jgi:hypothetical protein
VHASQRERLLRAAVVAVARKGCPGATVAIVHRAKESRAAFHLAVLAGQRWPAGRSGQENH